MKIYVHHLTSENHSKQCRWR